MKDLETSAVVLPGIINSAIKHGVDIQAILRTHGIALDLENITQTSVNLTVLHAIIMEIENASQIPAIGLQIGEAFDWDYVPNIKTYLMSAAILREAYHAFVYARKLISPLLILDMQENETDATLILRTDVKLSDEDERHYVEMVFATLKTIFGRLLKRDFTIKRMHFRHCQAHLLRIYEDCFNSAIELNAQQNAMIFDRAILDVPLQGGFPEIHHQAKQLIEHQLSDSPLQKGLVPKITWLLKRNKNLLSENIESVAGMLHMSCRTLQRRLDEEGVSFNKLKDQIRFKLARSALQSEKMSIENISEELGYSDRHSFARAFKRWSGISPSAFRKKHSK